MWKVSYYILGDLIRNRVILGYLLLMSSVGWGTFLLESQPEKALLVLMQATLLALPLITMVFTTIYYYNSLEFIVLILAQPITRSTVIKSFYAGLGISFILCFLIGVGLPLLLFHPAVESLTLLAGGIFLTLIFTAISLYLSVLMHDKARGMGITLLLWAFYAFIYDGLLLFFMYQFGDYPIEKTVLVLSFFNPIDIARILVIMKTEASAMLGLSGAVFRDFFGSSLGVWISVVILILWTTLPMVMTHRRFIGKDL